MTGKSIEIRLSSTPETPVVRQINFQSPHLFLSSPFQESGPTHLFPSINCIVEANQNVSLTIASL